MPEKGKAETSRRDEVELENQFILRMPEVIEYFLKKLCQSSILKIKF